MVPRNNSISHAMVCIPVMYEIGVRYGMVYQSGMRLVHVMVWYTSQVWDWCTLWYGIPGTVFLSDLGNPEEGVVPNQRLGVMHAPDCTYYSGGGWEGRREEGIGAAASRHLDEKIRTASRRGICVAQLCHRWSFVRQKQPRRNLLTSHIKTKKKQTNT